MMFYVAFDGLGAEAHMEYNRKDSEFLKAIWSGTVRFTVGAYSHWANNMRPVTSDVPSFHVLLMQLVQGKLVEVWRSPPATAAKTSIEIPTLTIPDGHYELTTSAPSTKGVSVIIKNNKANIPVPTHLVVWPAYIPGEWPNPMGLNPGLSEPDIVPWTGMRERRMTGVPLGLSKPTTVRLTRDKYWHESITLGTQQKEVVRWPSTTPVGGVMIHHNQRYFIECWDDINPFHAAIGDSVQASFSPTEDRDGYPVDSGIGVISSGYQHPVTGEWICLSPAGRIVKFHRDRYCETIFGHRRRELTLHPRHWDKAPTVTERVAYMERHYDLIGSRGIDLWRSWDITPDLHNPDCAYIASTGSHTIVKFNLEKKECVLVAGAEHVRGSDEGTRPRFDQPRGVTFLTKGQHAGKLLICDEHNSRIGVLNVLGGNEFTTLMRAKRVPQNPAVELGTQNPLTINSKPGLREIWGMPGPVGSVQKIADCQFIHPCHARELSDGRIMVVFHDAYQIGIIDLAEGTLTYWRDIHGVGTRTDALPRAWPTLFVDAAGAMGGKDDAFVCSWFQGSHQRLGQDGKVYLLTAGGSLTCEGPGDLFRQFAYPRVMIPGHDGSWLYHGDDANGVSIARPKQPADPVINMARLDAGKKVYRAEAKRSDGSTRPALSLVHGPSFQHEFADRKCGPEFAEMSQDAFNAYWRDQMGAGDLSDAQLKDLRYFAFCSSAEGIQKLREGVVV